jgi:hypothetical protein
MDRIDDLDDSDLIDVLSRIQRDLVVLALLRDELREIGIDAARSQAGSTKSIGEALMDALPWCCPPRGQVFGDIARAFQEEWERSQ